MSSITPETTLGELASLISQSLESAGIIATLSGGGAVSLYTDNEYQSRDLDFVTAAAHRELREAIAPLGFKESSNTRQFEHPDILWFVEFPPSPLGFGDLSIGHEDVPILETRHGSLRIITPTLCVMDRLAAYWYHSDRQCFDQAIMVAARQEVDWEAIYAWAEDEGQGPAEIDRLRAKAGK